MKQLFLVLIAVLVLVVLTAAAWLFSDGSPDQLLEDTPVAAADPQAEDEKTTPVAEIASPEAETDRSEIAAAEQTHEPLQFTDEIDESTARWILGVVVNPPGAPADDRLEVFALRRAEEYDALCENMSKAVADEDQRRRVRDLVISNCSVGEDGTFKIPLPEEREAAHLIVTGRYLYTPESVEVNVVEQTEPVQLETRSGTWITGQLVLPEGWTDKNDLAGIRVMLDTDRQSVNQSDYSEPETQELELWSDSEGRVEMYGVPVMHSYVVDALPDELAARRHSLIGLVAGTHREIELQLTQGGKVAGVVLDPDGNPVKGAEVTGYLRGRNFGFDDSEARQTETDDQGQFLLEGVVAGDIVVRADHSRYLQSKRETVEVVDGSTTEGMVIELSAGNEVGGTVTWKDGAPAPGLEVTARFDQAFLAGPSAFNMLRGATGDATTNAEGEFLMRGLGAGPFIVQVRATPPGFTGDEDELKDTEWYFDRREAVYPGEKELELVLHARPGLAGLVVDSEDNPVPKFQVRASRLVDAAFGSLSVATRDENFESEDGRFLLGDLLDGTWKVTILADQYMTPLPVQVQLPHDESDPMKFIVVETASVSGVVLSPLGTPVTDAEVKIDTGQPSWQGFIQSDEAPMVRTNGAGAFHFEHLPPGRVGLYADAEGYARSAAQTFELAIGEDVEEAKLQLTKGGTLTGLVYDNAGKPAAGRFVMLNQLDMQQRMDNADGAGEFIFENVTPGTWQVIAMDRDGDFSTAGDGNMSGFMDSMKMTQADIVEGETTHVILGAPPADPVRVFGKVTHSGEPYGGAITVFYPQGSKLWERMKFASVDDKGQYEITLDGPGSYVVFVQKMGRTQTQQQNIEFSEEIPQVEEYELDFELPLGRISGRVAGPDGAPAPGARITLAMDGGFRSDALFGGQYSEIVTDINGEYDLKGLRAGTYQISAGGAPLIDLGGSTESSVGRSTRGGVRLGEEEWKKDFDFRLQGPGSIEVSVIGADGQPAGSASVFARDPNGRPTEPFSLSRTDGAGIFTLRSLTPGDYTVVARSGLTVSPESPPVRVEEGKTTKIELRMEEGTILWIKLKDREGNDARASVSVLDSDGKDWASLFGIDDLQVIYLDGEFSPTEHRLGPLPPGKYRIHATAANGSKKSKPVTLHGEPERKITLKLR